MANHLDKILEVPVWPATRYADNYLAVESVGIKYFCLNCKNKLKIKNPEDIIRWRKCPTCGFVFVEKQYFCVDDLVNDTNIGLTIGRFTDEEVKDG